MRVTWAVLLLLLSPLSLEAHAQSQPAPPTEPAVAREIRIGPGDLLQVKVFGVSELTEDTRVSASGEIVLPLLGPLRVQALTPRETALLLEQRLKDQHFLLNPHVTVNIAEYATQGISILGEVQKPGVYPLLGPRRLHDAISVAGGTSPRAGRTVSIAHRDQSSAPLTVELADNVDILPGDTIVVAKAGVVYVVGDVAKPGGFLLDNNAHVSVLQALALAGGANKTAALSRARLIRRSPAGLEELAVPLNRMLSAQAQDTPLQADDILFIPGSAAKGAMRRSAEAVLQITTGVAIYRPL